ncbi:MAG: hypothetical protein C4527_18360 [Candidatus Omnitrophota bacterium]|jgi:hypothetical protein|nr:MAG: hypothetical protein C4527_18360 [Candidatus Omnitrophota bacterium]
MYNVQNIIAYIKSFTLLIGSIITCIPAIVYANGPLMIENGIPVIYPSVPVSLNMDQGPLGELTRTETVTMFRQAYGVWSNVTTSKFQFTEGGALTQDYTADNWPEDGWDTFADSGLNPVIFDNDGGLTDLLNGEGAKEEIFGSAGSNASPNQAGIYVYVNGTVLLNGWFLTDAAGESKQTAEQFLATTIHELGHFLGLLHTQANKHLASDGSANNDAYIPVMYPTNVDDDKMMNSLRFDDRVWLSMLYPKADGSFGANYGAISGQAKWADGSAMVSGHITARLVTDRNNTVVSGDTDYLKKNDGSFYLPGLPAGEYEVWIEPIPTDFNEGSAVGQHAESANDVAFTKPPQPEFYNTSESANAATDQPSFANAITVNAGQTTQILFHARAMQNEVERDVSFKPMAYNVPEIGYAIGSGPPNYGIVVDDKITDFTVTVKPDGNSKLAMYVKRNQAVTPSNDSDYIDKVAAAQNGQTITLTMNKNSASSTGGPTLQNGLYVFAVNVVSGSANDSFTITVTSSAAVEPTATPATTNTPIPTSTPVILPTSTPSIVIFIPTNTSTPIPVQPTNTATPIPVAPTSTSVPIVATSTPTPVPTTVPQATSTPTPTHTPAPAATSTPTTTSEKRVYIYDNPGDSMDLTGQTDFDAVDNRNITIAWIGEQGSATDWHIYVRKGFGGAKFLGRTASGSAKSFNWAAGAANLDAEFANGPDFNSMYTFRVIRIDGQLGPDDYFDMKQPMGFNAEGGNAVTISQPAMPNLNPGQIVVYDDILGGNDLAPMGSTGSDADDESARAIQIAWNFGRDVSTVNEYHVMVKVDGGDPQFLGQTYNGSLSYFWWTPNNLFRTSSAFAAGPQSGHTYQFLVILSPFSGNRTNLTSGTLTYTVNSSN